ncbi:thiamine pyrophosphate-dependent enzyme [Actinoplanes sp. KI2]|uniref:thiamine pyrophosphate-dependent enzyme n=1 Tax=Actinoplanes sp. KI2 TaxID=2983315 RepID=UPI0021D5D303|nr:thiamine pyrophosphate-dependent enzyme [Actinoplanes sp. KI2]MCU7725988.1 thiamine pyrophosphate-dependent enzyme [Actinoplanes sp. KI2]
MDGRCHCASVADLLRSQGISFCFAVPGAPITHVADTAGASMQQFEWAVNEKVAVENAIGLSCIGVRAAVMFKQNGLNVAADALVNAATHSIGAALLIIVADDVDCSRSTTLQDSRDLADLMRLPVVEPTMDGDLDRCVVSAVQISEAESIPVVLRLVGPIPPGAVGAPTTEHRTSGAPPVVNRSITQELTKLGRVQHLRLRQATEQRGGDALAPTTVCIEGPEGGADPHRAGIVAFGSAAGVAGEVDACRLVLRRFGTDEKEIIRFVEEHDRVLIAEEPMPALERRIRQLSIAGHQTIGRLTGHLPPEGRLDAELLQKALVDGPRDWNTVDRKPSRLAPHAGYHDLFEAIADLRREGLFVAADVGSSVNLCYPPYAASDTAICLGSAVSVASGAARAARPAIAVIGDYALLHTGLQAVVDVALRRLPVVVIVLANGVQEKTGGQPVWPGAGGRDRDAAILNGLLAGVAPGVPVEAWDARQTGLAETTRKLRSLLAVAPAVALVSDRTA